ncbi:large ribosomal subunit protein mL63 [Euwallacea fornicatus]|uniref:large ribosomal subunit protein mL63 n=1 Tax=Euwallacea fornicatus TaxID=995702 RepID=UPI00338FC4F7
MRLFAPLFRKTRIPGHLWKGKKRRYAEVTNMHLAHLREQLEIEEKNMFYLRHAFLSPEQSFGHGRALGKNEENYVKTITKRNPYYDNVSIKSRLAHLRHGEKWD